jgi:hypothetical protein
MVLNEHTRGHDNVGLDHDPVFPGYVGAPPDQAPVANNHRRPGCTITARPGMKPDILVYDDVVAEFH